VRRAARAGALPRAAALAWLFLGCVAGAGPAQAASAVSVPAGPVVSEAPASVYDRPGVVHNEQCVAPVHGGRVIVRGVEGKQLRTLAGPVSEPPEARETCSAAPGIRLEGIEAVSAPAATLYYSWPLERGQQASGFIAAGELASAPALDAADAAGNGAPAPGEPVYEVTPEDIASAQRYAGPTTGVWYTFSVYGRPLGGAAFALMSWSWVDVRGGGIARAAVPEGALFHPAAVAPITMASFAGAGEPQNGTVTVRYGYVDSGEQRLYGWMVTSHTYEGLCYDHMAYAGGGPALAGTLCAEGALSDSIGDGMGALTG
jgi:hypothetical protein